MNSTNTPTETLAATPPAETTRPHILVVDDDTNHLASVRRILKRSGFEVTTATGGTQALKKLKNKMPDLVLLDVSMPMMSGHVFIRWFRKFEAMHWGGQRPEDVAPTPVVFLSGHGRLQQRISGLDAGAVDYLVKPCDPEELRARVRSHLRNARRGGPAAA